MLHRSVLVSLSASAFVSIASLVALAPLGCAAPTSSSDETGQAASADSELASSSSQLVGRYFAHPVARGGFSRLNLNADGRYSAEVDPAGQIQCVRAPCLLPESGTWAAYRATGNTLRLQIRPNSGSVRQYTATKNGAQLTLEHDGTTEVLTSFEPNGCFDDGDCSNDQQCGPRLCAMMCVANDPFCCGPSTCRPKTPPPPPPPSSCKGLDAAACENRPDCEPVWGRPDCRPGEMCPMFVIYKGCEPKSPTGGRCDGASRDPRSGRCLGPADRPLPPSCCEPPAPLPGPTCGDNQCAFGEVCCNPLEGICTKPGAFCAL